MIKKALLLLLLAIPCFGVEDSTPLQLVGPFGTLNNQDDPMVLPNNMAQDLLNVEITPEGKSVRKRKGLSLAFTLQVATAPVHGIYSFYDASGNDVSLFFNDHHLSASVNGASPTVLFSTGTVDATWQCTDSLGYAYCAAYSASAARQPLIKTNGITAGQVTMVDTGTMVTSTIQRLVTSGFNASPSQIDFSGANDFTNWTLGGLATSPYTETINAPGSRITHITAACNGLMWFKDASFGIILNPDDSLNAQNVILAPEIGTLDNTSIQYPGGIQFRSQDGHIYNFDCAGIEKLTRDITPTINGSGSRRSNAWTITSQSDFQTGTSSPTNPYPSLNYTISAGDVQPSSFTTTETSTQWGLGSASSVSVGASSITLTINNSGNVTNNSFDTAGGTAQDVQSWTRTSASGPTVQRGTSLSWGASCSGATTSPKSGTGAVSANYTTSTGAQSRTWSILLASDNSSLSSTSVPTAKACADWNSSITLSAGSNVGKRVRLKLTAVDINGTNTLIQDTSFILGGDITIYYIKEADNTAGSSSAYFDDITNGSSTITTGNFTSQAINTRLPYSFVLSSATWNVNTSTPSFILQKSADGSTGWLEVGNSTGTNIQINQPYIRYITTFTITAGDNALSSLTGVNFIARSSGTYYSAVHNAPSLTSWDTFTPTSQDNGGSHAFYIRASSYPFTIFGSSPSWVAQTAGAVVSASTGVYFQVIDSFTITHATDTPTLSAFAVNWFEGTAADKPYGIYFGKDNALWWSVASGAGQSTNNRILRWDLINHGWTLYDIPSNGFLIRNQSLYIGSASAGKIYKYGDTDSDAGVAINSYWKSKDFFGDSPLNDKEFRTLSVIAKSVINSSMTVTYTLNASSSTAYSLYLYNSASSILRNNRYLPAGRVGNTFNVQFGNNAADQYWEVFGLAFRYALKPWIIGN